jgi:ATP-dependent Lhr-like helicase
VERVAIPKEEWMDLLRAIRRDHEVDPEGFLDQLGDRIVRIQPREDGVSLVAAREMLPQIRVMYGPGRLIRIESFAAAPLRTESLDSENGHEEPEESAGLLGQWLQFYGPVTVDFIRRTLGMEGERLQLALEDLIDSQKVIQGQLVTDGTLNDICDSENFETLLRSARVEPVPSFEPLGIEWLPFFLADYQGITEAQESPQDGPQDKIEKLHGSLGQLACYPAEAELWESAIFPARLHPYDPSWLDSLMQEGGLLWLGSEGHHITFCFEPDVDLLQEDSSQEKDPDSDENHSGTESSHLDFQSNLFRDPAAHYDFSTLLQLSKGSDVETAKRLWDDVWKGRITNDTFITLRRAILNRFDLRRMMAKNAKRTRNRMSRRRRLSLVTANENYPFVGNWRLVQKPELPGDLLETEERRKDRVRLLLDRYGILFREILQKEWPPLRWSSLFRALRIMELSGEVISGIFFHGIPGPQFISQKAFRRLQQKLPEKRIFWINAADPVSLCGLQIDNLRGMLPPRVSSTHLVYRGKDLKVISKRSGRDLSFLVAHDDPDLPDYFISLKHLLTRKFQPMRRIAIETINDGRATESPYIPALRTAFDVSIDPGEVVLFRRVTTNTP